MEQDTRRRRILLLASAGVVVVTLAVLYLLGTALLPLGLSVIIAYVLLPVAWLLERVMPWRRSRPGLSRGYCRRSHLSRRAGHPGRGTGADCPSHRGAEPGLR